MKKIITILLISVIAIFSLMLFIKDNREVSINKEIPGKSKDIKQLTELVSSYLSEYYHDNNYHLGEVSIQSKSNLEGEIRLIFASDNDSKSEVVEVLLDTEINKAISLTSLGTDDVLNPGVIYPEDWSFNYYEAHNIAKDYLIGKITN